MQLFDSHNHIQDERLFPQVDAVMARARDAGVVKMGVKGCFEADWPRVIAIMESYEGIHPSFGMHPWFIAERSESWLKTLEKLLMQYPQAGVGEIGIDHKVEHYDADDQETVFLAQLELAQRLARPVSIHCRNAWGRLIALLDEVGTLPRGMLIHCFGGSTEVALELVKRGGYISFSGSITRPNNKKAGPAIRALPVERILIETDAPDIMPHMVDEASSFVGQAGSRGRTFATKLDASSTLNEPANIRFVLAKAAEFLQMPETELADLTFSNAERFFASEGTGS